MVATPSPCTTSNVRPGLLAALLLLSACGTLQPQPVVPEADSSMRATDRSSAAEGFLVGADRMDAWNAVGQLLVRTEGVQFEARAEMLDLHAVRYRGEGLLVLTRAVPLSADVRTPTVRVTAAAQDGAALDSDAAHALLEHLQAALPAEITRVRAVQAAQAAAAAGRANKASRPARRARRR